MEDERAKYFLECINKFRELDEERFATEFPVKNNKEEPRAKEPSIFVNFKPPKDLQLVRISS